jgi:UDP-N-acetylglucosamine pyrophosphorylase
MTSPKNDAATRGYFERCGHFGLKNLHFFSQTMAPLLDECGGVCGEAPDGNGSVFRAFMALEERCREQGIHELQLVAIDNPLSYLFDPQLIGFHQQQKADATVSCVRREPGNSMGLLVEREGRIAIVEYSEVKLEKLESGLYPYGNAGRWVVDLDLVCAMAKVEMPWHWAYKRGLWKRERFLIDVLFYAERARALCFPRERSYRPIKSLQDVALVE